MKLALSGLIALGVIGALPWMMFDGKGDLKATASFQERKEALLRYRLNITGRDDTCTVAKGDLVTGDRAELEMAPGCVALMPRLGEARYWKEGTDGEVIFAAADGRVIAEFYAADGVAYESVRPISPLMSLTAQ